MKCLYSSCYKQGSTSYIHKGFCSLICKSKYEEENKPRDNSSPIWDIGMVNSFDTPSYDSPSSSDSGSDFSGGGGSFDGGGSSGDW